MNHKKLQKPALISNPSDLPIEILDPTHSGQYYSLKTYQPPEQLSLFIDHYWVLRWDIPAGILFTAEAIPSPYINLTLMREGATITGVTTGKYTYNITGSGTIIGAKFKVGGYYPFSKRSASEITGKVIPAVSIFETATDSVNKKALSADTDNEALQLLEGILLHATPQYDSALKLIDTIITEIKAGEHASTASIAIKHQLTERRLQEMFQKYVGVGPKWTLLRYRLLTATLLAAKPAKQNWTDIALELGYTDQSHFINDFKRIIGKTPKQYSDETKAQLSK
jgi:AraC-like DNA-binding protein